MPQLTYWVAHSASPSQPDVYAKTKREASLQASSTHLPVVKKVQAYADAFDLLTKAVRGELT